MKKKVKSRPRHVNADWNKKKKQKNNVFVKKIYILCNIPLFRNSTIYNGFFFRRK